MENLGLSFNNVSLNLPEFQGEPEYICKEKVKLAAKEINGPAIVEDVSLCFNALKGLPGPYIKDFFEKLGLEGLNKLLAGFEDKSAYAQCIFGYCAGPDQEPLTFVGRCPGTIVAPKGPTTFGWDPIF